MSDFIQFLEAEFRSQANPQVAAEQKAYLKGRFEFFGLKTPIRRDIQKPFLDKNYLPPKSELEPLVRELWAKPEREFHYFAQELTHKYTKQFEESDIDLFEFMAMHWSWWDTLDFIAPKLMGDYFKKYPQKRNLYIDKWLDSGNMWLQRACLIFQLKYKTELDTELLSRLIERLLGSKEFFINKAIGWMLRDYSRINPQWVIRFVEMHELSNLSRKEALRLIS